MKAIIIEDEPIAAERLRKLIAEVSPGTVVAAVLESVEKAVEWLRTETADLIFADIQLSDGICFDIFEQVHVRIPVIFTTAYDQYMIEAFKVNSISYLLKPVSKMALSESLAKYSEMKAAFTPDLEQILARIQGREQVYRRRFLIQYGEKIRKIETEEIAFFYALEKNVFVRTFHDQDYPLEYTLDKIEDLVDPAQFFRINRKFIVNMKAIVNMTAWSRSRVKIDLVPAFKEPDETIVSVERSAEFKKWLNS